jgi:hypothetical protein
VTATLPKQVGHQDPPPATLSPATKASGQEDGAAPGIQISHSAAADRRGNSRHRYPCGPRGLFRRPALVATRRGLARGGAMGLEVGAPPESLGTGHAGAEAHTSKLAGTDTGTGIGYAIS